MFEIHPVQFIRNTVFLGIVLFLNFSKNSTSSVAYLFLNFYMMKYSLVSKNISLNSFLYQACQKYGDCTVSWTYLKSLNSFHLIMWDKIHILYYILHTYLFLKLTIFTRFLCVQAWPCFLNFSILLVYVSYFYQDLNYVSYEVFLINCTGCMTSTRLCNFGDYPI